MGSALEARVLAALAAIRNPRLENDLLSAGMIRDLTVTDEGGVGFTFLLAPEDPATLVRQARSAVQGASRGTLAAMRLSRSIAWPTSASTCGPSRGIVPVYRTSLPLSSSTFWPAA